MRELATAGGCYTVSIAREQAKRAGVDPSRPFTRSIDQRTGKVTVTPRTRTATERRASYLRLSKTMERERRYERLRRDIGAHPQPNNGNRWARYERLSRQMNDETTTPRNGSRQPGQLPVPVALSWPRQH